MDIYGYTFAGDYYFDKVHNSKKRTKAMKATGDECEHPEAAAGVEAGAGVQEEAEAAEDPDSAGEHVYRAMESMGRSSSSASRRRLQVRRRPALRAEGQSPARGASCTLTCALEEWLCAH